MVVAIVILSIIWIGYLIWEQHTLRVARGKLQHIIHVNGTRGKSSVSRMIDAGLRSGGYRVYCKTTGTDPMIIDVEGKEKPLHRVGKANIREQIRILRDAAGQGAEILVIECMAVNPELQFAAQHQILKADIGVITNVRRDHMDVMGESLQEIALSLSNTIPSPEDGINGGMLFTAESDEERLAVFEKISRERGLSYHPVKADGSEDTFDFPDNIALALAVCQAMGVDRDTAARGMKEYRRDPYVLSLHHLGQGYFANGLSINDMQSISIVWHTLCAGESLQGARDRGRLILLVNNRPDRQTRTRDMADTCRTMKPDEIWLLGASQNYMKRLLPAYPIRGFRSAEELPFMELRKDDVVFAIGNLAGQGRSLMDRVRKEGVLCTTRLF